MASESETAADEFPDVLKSDKCTYLKGEKLGAGSFGEVFYYKTQDTFKKVAVKFMDKTDGRDELKILNKIRVFDPDENCLVRVLEHFEYKSTMCVLFEKLDQTVSSFAMNRKKPYDVCELRPVAQQLMVALKALKSIGVVHCDIKPNNIMLVDQQSSPYKVKLIDFGLARKKSKLTCQSRIQVLGYKAPEAVFGCPMDEGVDMWSVGCVLASLYRGKHFYLRTCLYEYIASVVHLQGQPPDSILKKGIRVKNFFNFNKKSEGSKYTFKTADEYMPLPIECQFWSTINLFMKQNFTLDDLLKKRLTGEDSKEDESDFEEFKSLLKQMLNVDPTKRITPEEALNHSFITMSHLSSRTDDSYVKEAQQFMSVCQPTTSVETDAHKTDGKTVCGQNTKVNSTPTSVQDSAVPPVKKTTKKKTLATFLTGKSYSSVNNTGKVPHKIVDKIKHTTSKDVADNLATSSSVSKQVSKKKKMNNKVLKGNTSSGTSETPEESSVKEVNTRMTSFHSKCDKKANKRPPSMEAKTNRETTKGLVDSLRSSFLRGVLRKKNGSNKINSTLVEECPHSASLSTMQEELPKENSTKKQNTSDTVTRKKPYCPVDEKTDERAPSKISKNDKGSKDLAGFPSNSRNSSGLEILNAFYSGEKNSFVQVKSNKTILMRVRGFFSKLVSKVST
ncbi:Homeodomain-interacting protein kinase 2 [Oryzias melastigma]|uniref:Homeodomain-interacting protein kinase 2 n=1 Tax=Oryzias melastigma TaxID=30732 RepID=A0A834BUG0_ORYME|nr:Homeodomain-interacting protein kinase 2 [Oryzias melastigma]